MEKYLNITLKVSNLIILLWFLYNFIYNPFDKDINMGLVVLIYLSIALVTDRLLKNKKVQKEIVQLIISVFFVAIYYIL